MMSCTDCRTLLLDDLYGLLDPAEAAAVAAHVATCPACATARAAEGKAQGLFARAAKREFPHVKFELPKSEPAPARRPAAARFAGWAVAASVLAAVSAAGLGINSRIERSDTARAAARAAATEAGEARVDAESHALSQRRAAERAERAQGQLNDVLAQWVQAEKAAAAPAGKALAIRVTKPTAVQPGAANTFALHVQTDAPPAGPVFAEVRNQSGATLYSARFDYTAESRDGLFRLPADVWRRVKPDDELFLAVATVDAAGTKTDIQEPIRLFGPVYTTALTTDRTDYRPGEPVYFRSLTLDRVSFRPPAREQNLQYELKARTTGQVHGTVSGSTELARVAGGRVEPVAGPDGQPLRGVGCGVVVLPADLPDGDYTLTLTEVAPPNGLPPAVAFPVTRTIRVRSGAAERYQKKIGFGGAGYAPGQAAEGWAELKQQDQPAAGVPVTMLAMDASGKEIPMRTTPATGPDGRARFLVHLPPTLPPGDVRVKITFHTPGNSSEEVAGRVPVVGRNLHVEFFPEGGTLVAGVANRVYVRATSPDGTPVDLSGFVTDGGDTIARVETPRDAAEPGVNRGVGAFTFTPKPGARYWLKLRSPAGPYEPPLHDAGLAAAGGSPAVAPGRTGFALPPAADAGVAMTIRPPVTTPGQPVRVTLTSAGKDRTLVVGAYTRGRLSDTQTVTVKAGESLDVELLKEGTAASGRGGVVRVTVFEERGEGELAPVAERLVYRKPAEALTLDVGVNGTPLGKTPVFNAGDRLSLNIRATDESGQPKAAVLYAAVTNAGGTAKAKDRLFTSQFLIAGEVQNPDDLEYADFLLSSDARAADALDRVLATQGWRRFVEQQAPPIDARAAGTGTVPATPADRLRALNGATPETVDPAAARQRKVQEQFRPQYDEAERRAESARAAKAAKDADKAAEAKAGELLSAYAASQEKLAELNAAVTDADRAVNWIDRQSWRLVGVLAVAAVAFLGLAVARRRSLTQAAPLALAAVACVGLAVYLGVTFPRPAFTAEVPAQPVPEPNDGNGPVVLPSVAVDTPPPTLPPGKESVGPSKQGTVQAIKAGPRVGPMAFTADRTSPLDQRIPLGRREEPAAASKKVAPLTADDAAALKATAEAAGRFAQQRNRAAGEQLAPFAAEKDAQARVQAAIEREPPLVVREYAAPRPGSTEAAADPDAVLWQPVIVLPADGRATLDFRLGGSPAGYDVIVAGHTPDGRIGAVRGLLPVVPGR